MELSGRIIRSEGNYLMLDDGSECVISKFPKYSKFVNEVFALFRLPVLECEMFPLNGRNVAVFWLRGKRIKPGKKALLPDDLEYYCLLGALLGVSRVDCASFVACTEGVFPCGFTSARTGDTKIDDSFLRETDKSSDVVIRELLSRAGVRRTECSDRDSLLDLIIGRLGDDYAETLKDRKHLCV